MYQFVSRTSHIDLYRVTSHIDLYRVTSRIDLYRVTSRIDLRRVFSRIDLYCASHIIDLHCASSCIDFDSEPNHRESEVSPTAKSELKNAGKFDVTNERIISIVDDWYFAEWPRSLGARENTLRKSLNSTPPMSFIVIDKKTDKLIGHARLCPLLTVPQSCWIESVIISSDLRGKGLGCWLMNQLENEARKFGFKKIYLSSENKQAFYSKCGYSACEPVLNVGANTVLFERFDLGRCLLPAFNGSISN
ncbi:unnamed protein product, partial [Onchocerca ochengi]|uniref:N-acetyltransferase domain-containing protein n=1 Tax=Onchocerca ochengi TaxID=42157 RepID=A0A182EGU5_ONCOC